MKPIINHVHRRGRIDLSTWGYHILSNTFCMVSLAGRTDCNFEVSSMAMLDLTVRVSTTVFFLCCHLLCSGFPVVSEGVGTDTAMVVEFDWGDQCKRVCFFNEEGWTTCSVSALGTVYITSVTMLM